MKILVFLANGFEEIEAIAPIDIFKRAGIDTETISISNNREVAGAHGITVLADKIFSEAVLDESDLIFLPGGMPGTTNLDAHEGLKKVILAQITAERKVAAICAAPSILGKMGLLAGKEAICYPGFEQYLTGATVSESKVVQSGLITTAKGAGVAIQLALSVVADLKGKSEAERIAASIFL